MKKIINGKVYDTATAQKIAEWEINLPTDINYLCESLYLKKTGEYFIFGSGGANTRYAAVSGSGNFRSGELIVPITLDNAFQSTHPLRGATAKTYKENCTFFELADKLSARIAAKKPSAKADRCA